VIEKVTHGSTGRRWKRANSMATLIYAPVGNCWETLPCLQSSTAPALHPTNRQRAGCGADEFAAESQSGAAYRHERREQGSPSRSEQVVTPGHRVLQGLLPTGQVTCPGRQNRNGDSDRRALSISKVSSEFPRPTTMGTDRQLSGTCLRLGLRRGDSGFRAGQGYRVHRSRFSVTIDRRGAVSAVRRQRL
jgi:hypothetical protein